MPAWRSSPNMSMRNPMTSAPMNNNPMGNQATLKPVKPNWWGPDQASPLSAGAPPIAPPISTPTAPTSPMPSSPVSNPPMARISPTGGGPPAVPPRPNGTGYGSGGTLAVRPPSGPPVGPPGNPPSVPSLRSPGGLPALMGRLAFPTVSPLPSRAMAMAYQQKQEFQDGIRSTPAVKLNATPIGQAAPMEQAAPQEFVQSSPIRMPASQVGRTHPATRAPGSPERIYNPNGGYGPSGQGIIPGSGIYGQKRPNMSPDEYRVLTGGKPMFSPRDINPSLPANDPNAISGGNPNSATRATLLNRQARQLGVRGANIAQWRQLRAAGGQGAGAIAGSSAISGISGQGESRAPDWRVPMAIPEDQVLKQKLAQNPDRFFNFAGPRFSYGG